MEISDEFILSYRGYIKYFELITAIIATIYYAKYKNTYLKYLLYLLWYVVFNEFLGAFLRIRIGIDNILIFNIYTLLNFSYLLSVYYIFLKKKYSKSLIKCFIIMYVITFLVNIFFEDYVSLSNTIPYLMGCCFLCISIILYFIEILNSDKVLQVKNNLLFWISMGLLLFHIGVIPYRIIRNHYENIENFNYIVFLFHMLILILNVCYIIGFIWSHKMQDQE